MQGFLCLTVSHQLECVLYRQASIFCCTKGASKPSSECSSSDSVARCPLRSSTSQATQTVQTLHGPSHHRLPQKPSIDKALTPHPSRTSTGPGPRGVETLPSPFQPVLSHSALTHRQSSGSWQGLGLTEREPFSEKSRFWSRSFLW